jgi:hypothetical protein
MVWHDEELPKATGREPRVAVAAGPAFRYNRDLLCRWWAGGRRPGITLFS